MVQSVVVIGAIVVVSVAWLLLLTCWFAREMRNLGNRLEDGQTWDHLTKETIYFLEELQQYDWCRLEKTKAEYGTWTMQWENSDEKRHRECWGSDPLAAVSMGGIMEGYYEQPETQA